MEILERVTRRHTTNPLVDAQFPETPRTRVTPRTTLVIESQNCVTASRKVEAPT